MWLNHFGKPLSEDANQIAQRAARFHLVLFSNFLTLADSVRQFARPLAALMSDLRPGSAVVVLGAKGRHYGDIYNELTVLAQDSGMTLLKELPSDMEGKSYQEAAAIISQCQYDVHRHLQEIVGKRAVRKTKERPDHSNPNPHPDKRTGYGLRVFRKGR